jgi:hypothetical protein
MKCWMDNQHMAMWQCFISTKGQAQKLISGSSLIAETRLLSFNRTESRAVTSLLIGHNTLRRHLYVMGLMDSPYVGGVQQRRVHEPLFCVSVKPWLHSGISILAHFSWTQRMLEVKI